MAKQGHFSKSLADCPRPVCPACLYGRALKCLWRTKGKQNRPIRKQPKEGDEPNELTCSTDSFVLSVPGLILQPTGFLLNAKYTAGTVFLDHTSGLCYEHNQVDQTSDAAIKDKEAWEQLLATYGSICILLLH